MEAQNECDAKRSLSSLLAKCWREMRPSLTGRPGLERALTRRGAPGVDPEQLLQRLTPPQKSHKFSVRELANRA